MEYWQIVRQAMGAQQVIIPGAAGAVYKNGKILLVKHKLHNKWMFPGGVQELNEAITDTVRREIREELNLEVKTDNLVSVFSSPRWIQQFPNGDLLQNMIFFFRMTGPVRESDIVIQDEEITDYAFFHPRRIPADTEICCIQKCKDLLAFRGRVFFH